MMGPSSPALPVNCEMGLSWLSPVGLGDILLWQDVEREQKIKCTIELDELQVIAHHLWCQINLVFICNFYSSGSRRVKYESLVIAAMKLLNHH
jgi:hypothetical protein